MLENMDLVEYYCYGYKNLIVSFNLTYQLCVNFFDLLDLKVRIYVSFNDRMLYHIVHAKK